VTFVRRNLISVFPFAMIAALVCAAFLVPLLGPAMFFGLASIVGPTFLFWSVLCFVQIAVFCPITQNAKGHFTLDEGVWEAFVSTSLFLAVVLTPLHNELRGILHKYYKRSLQVNYFEGGNDLPFRQLLECPYCPFVILTGTSSDFQPPGDTDTISELSFSPMHFGGEETGYTKTPAYRSLAKCTAITGAGCLDAITLSMSDALSMRFWLEALNLSWGDYVIFEHVPCLSSLGKRMPRTVRFLHRLPTIVIFTLVYLLFSWSWAEQHRTRCSESAELLWAAVLILSCVWALSFYNFVPCLEILALSPMIRQVHQATRYLYVGERPPRMLYMTDGGVRDCTSIVQLLWRRCERILLVLAAADPHDELKVLIAAMSEAKRLELASFFDPDDPRRELKVLLDEYKRDTDRTYLRIGICYCWDEGYDGSQNGHLIIVKSRLPPSFAGQPVQPLLRESDFRVPPDERWTWSSSEGADDSDVEGEAWRDLSTDQLGSLGCCDCCHTSGLNCGPKFPHGTFTGYLYLTPEWFNSLARLGYDLSAEAVALVQKPGSVGHSNDPAAARRRR